MSTNSQRIAAVLQARKSQIPVVEREVAFWENIKQLVNGLGTALIELRVGGVEDEAIATVADLDTAELSKITAQSLELLADIRTRVGRRTINIGVSGRARNGKSTLLQSLSGLTDQQIPAGRGQPVTAVRSTIYHSVIRTEAVLTMHSESSFCREVVAPYHRALKLLPLPSTLDEFSQWRYPSTANELVGDVDPHPKSGPMLTRLREMQQALPSFRGYLTGEPRRVDRLDDLRQWVAYPAPGDGSGSAAPDRRYLAVRDAEISCRFPIDDVVDLGLVDLPGLGELVPDAEEHHLDGLKNDVDFVLVVKRPTDTNALWSVEDGQALQLIGEASGAASMRDFMAILVNSGGCDKTNIDALRRDIRDRLNEGADGRFYRMITADAADRETVKEEILRVILDHLATALPRMDDDVIGYALATCAANRRQLLATTNRFLQSLRTVPTTSPSRDIHNRAKALRLEAAGSLEAWVQSLWERTKSGYEDEEFHAEVARVQAESRDWILGGFDDGSKDAWTGRVVGEMVQNGSPLSSIQEALNSIRVTLAKNFSGIDDLLEQRQKEFWAGLSMGLGPTLGALLESSDPQEALRKLEKLFDDAPDRCPALAEAVHDVLDVRLDYRTRLLPQVRRVLEALLAHSHDDGENLVTSLAQVNLDEDGANELFRGISQAARQVVHDIGGVLAQEPATTASILLAYGQQFVDSFIRSRDSADEFLDITVNFRDQLWPKEFSGPATATARVQRTKHALTQLIQALEENSGVGDDRRTA